MSVQITDEQLDEIAARIQPATTASPWLNVADAAAWMRCKPDRVYDLVALGKLKPRRDGGKPQKCWVGLALSN